MSFAERWELLHDPLSNLEFLKVLVVVTRAILAGAIDTPAPIIFARTARVNESPSTHLFDPL